MLTLKQQNIKSIGGIINPKPREEMYQYFICFYSIEISETK